MTTTTIDGAPSHDISALFLFVIIAYNYFKTLHQDGKSVTRTRTDKKTGIF